MADIFLHYDSHLRLSAVTVLFSSNWLARHCRTATGGRGFMGLIDSFAFGVVGEQAPAIGAEARLYAIADG